jgi:tRNA modification GTPase
MAADYQEEDTIAALATPVGEGGIAVIRVSGPGAAEISARMLHFKNRTLPMFASHTIHLATVQTDSGDPVDQVMVSFFRSPHSYTGQDVVEISSHGGMAVTQKILQLLFQAGARHAAPGEFTKRAFLNGKIDLTQAEAVVDLIKAKSTKAAEVAARQLAGSLSRKLQGLKAQLMKLYAHLEAYLDFPDEHLEVYGQKEIALALEKTRQEVEELLASFGRASLLREGAVVALVGKPNVGKSSLFNALLERDRALVSPLPGTTRDHLEEYLEIEGAPIRLLDTAGLAHVSENPLDQLGMARTRHVLAEAHAYLLLVDGAAPLDARDREVVEALDAQKPCLVIVHKSDLARQLDLKALAALTGQTEPLFVSSQTREGMESLEKRISAALFGSETEIVGEKITRLRHKNALETALAALLRAQSAFAEQASLEFLSLELKTALDSLKELVGEVYSEDLLDIIFSEFCIGK